MKKNIPYISSFILFLLLCASGTYWAMQLIKPKARPVAMPARAPAAEFKMESAAALFGGQGSNGIAESHFQLKGVLWAGNPRDSVAIISAEGKAARAYGVNAEVIAGITVKEVHKEYVLLSEGGAIKRVNLPVKNQPRIGVSLYKKL